MAGWRVPQGIGGAWMPHAVVRCPVSLVLPQVMGGGGGRTFDQVPSFPIGWSPLSRFFLPPGSPCLQILNVNLVALSLNLIDICLHVFRQPS